MKKQVNGAKRKISKQQAVITGGGTGLGRASATRLADDDFAVAVLGRRA